MILAFTGMPGVGKSTAITYIKNNTDVIVHSTDKIRKELFETPEYTSEESKKTYNTLFSRVKQSVSNGETVVIDATMNLEKGRAEVESISNETECSTLFVHVTCREKVAKSRLQKRSNNDDTVSDATVSTYDEFYFEPLTRDNVTIDNSTTMEALQAQLEARVIPIIDGERK